MARVGAGAKVARGRPDGLRDEGETRAREAGQARSDGHGHEAVEGLWTENICMCMCPDSAHSFAVAVRLLFGADVAQEECNCDLRATVARAL